jgi:uncharacterized protein YbcV (DUF1398 family)
MTDRNALNAAKAETVRVVIVKAATASVVIAMTDRNVVRLRQLKSLQKLKNKLRQNLDRHVLRVPHVRPNQRQNSVL